MAKRDRQCGRKEGSFFIFWSEELTENLKLMYQEAEVLVCY